MRSKRLTVQQKQEIFHALVVAQDEVPLNVRRSYQVITEKFEITDAQLRQIEQEGIDKEWPPLNEPLSAAVQV